LDGSRSGAFQLEQPARQRLGLEQQRRIGGHDDLTLHAGGFEHLLRRALAHRDRSDSIERLAHDLLRGGIVQRSRADRVAHHRDALLLRKLHLAQVNARLGVVEDAAATQDQQIELLDLRGRLGARKIAHRDRALDAVSLQGVVGVAREHGDLGMQIAPQLGDDRLQDRLVAKV
jgi:hypothetical protein